MRSNDNKKTTLSPRKRSLGSSRIAWLSQRTLSPYANVLAWIAWQANTTLVSYANVLYVRQHMTLHKDCVTSQQNVSIHHKGSFKRTAWQAELTLATMQSFTAHDAVLDKASDTVIWLSFQCVRHTYQNNTVNTVPVSLGYGRQLGLTENKDHSLLVYQ